MAKTINGAALISYGPTLPAAITSADGSLFYKTTNTGGADGLYVYGYLADSNPGALGQQVAQAWISTTPASGTLPGGSVNGMLTIISTPAPVALELVSNGPSLKLTDLTQAANSQVWVIQNSGTFSITTRDDANTVQGIPLSISRAGLLQSNGSTVWHQGNDGSGSGLDADLLDGNDSIYFLNISNMNAGTLSVARGGTNSAGVTSGGVAFGAAAGNAISYSAVGAVGQVLTANGASAPVWANQSALSVGFATNATNAVSATNAGNSGTTSQTTFGRVRTDGVNRGPHGSISISGADAGYAGIDFTAVSTTLMVQNSGAIGFYKNAASWVWQIDTNGALAVGTVPYGLVTGAPTTLSAFTNNAGYITAASLSSYVAKSGDIMTGALGVPTLAVGSVSAPSNGSVNVQGIVNSASVSASGGISAGGNLIAGGGVTSTGSISSSSGSIISSTSFVRAGTAGSTGYVQLQPPGNSNSGYMEFYGSSQVRAGYIGNAASVGAADTGSLSYVAGAHNFNGPINSTGPITLPGVATLALQAVPKQQLDDAIAFTYPFFAPGQSAPNGNGYITFRNGLIFQWCSQYFGDVPGGGGATGTVNFPISFPNACVSCHLTLYNAGGASFGASGTLRGVLTQSQAEYLVQEWDGTLQNLTVCIFAIGY